MFKFKKIASVIVGTVLASSTIAFAAAANYPDPFIKSGNADIAVVYGSNSGAEFDLLAVLDINSNLQTTLATQTASGGSSGSRASGNDFVQLDKSNNRLNLGDAISGPFGTSVDEDDLPGLLADGTYTADDSDTFDYEQKITLGAAELAYFRDSDYEALAGLSSRTPSIGINISDSQFVLNYTLDFLDDAESDVASSDLEDLEGSFLPLFGKTFYVSDWKNGTVAGNTGKLTLLDSATKGIIKEGETITLTQGGKSYEVKISYVDSDSAKLSINGKLTSDLTKGQTEKLPDGTYVGITEVTKLEVAGELGTVEFSLGSGKLELTHGSEVILNGDTISDLRSYMEKGSASAGTEKVNKIVLEWKAEDELFISPDLDITMPGFGGLSFTMNALVRSTEEKITIEADGDNSVQLIIPVKDGIADINLLYSNSTDKYIGIGKDSDEHLATSSINRLTFWDKKNNVDWHKQFVATYNDTDSAQSYVLSFKPKADTSNNRNETDIKNEVTGVFIATDKVAGDEITLGDVSFTIESIFVNSTDKYVNITAGTNVNFNTVYSAGGLRFYLPVAVSTIGGTMAPTESVGVGPSQLHNAYAEPNDRYGVINFTGDGASDVAGSMVGHNNTEWYLTMDGEDKDDNIAGGVLFEARLNHNSQNEVTVDQLNTTTQTFAGTGGVRGLELGDTKVYQTYVYDDIATRILHYTDPDQDRAEVYYPSGKSESYAEVFLKSATATVTGATNGSTGSIKELGNVYFKDNEASKFDGKNLIVVGGSCVNKLASELLGGAGCGQSFEDATGVGTGNFLIQTFSRSNDKVATLVAGYNVDDTRNAAKVLTTATVDTTASKKYKSTSATTVELVEAAV